MPAAASRPLPKPDSPLLRPDVLLDENSENNGGVVMEERWTREQIETKTRFGGRERAYDESSAVRRFLFAPPAFPARFNLVCLLLRRRNEPRKRFPLAWPGAHLLAAPNHREILLRALARASRFIMLKRRSEAFRVGRR